MAGNKNGSALGKKDFFDLAGHGTNVKTEVIAGITTFLAMAYILAVNPSMLKETGMDQNAVFVATALSAALATFIMGFLANYPVALASGMGLNAYFTYTVCLSMGLGENAWKIALTAVLVEGLIFIVLSSFKFREKIVNGIPANLKYAITAGIGLFITLIGCKGAGIVVSNSSTLVGLGDFASPTVILAFIGLIVLGVLHHFRVKGAILISILVTWVLGIVAELGGWYQVNVEAGVFSNIPSFSNYTPFPSLAPTFFQFDFGYVTENFMNFIIIVFAFLFVDLFDTLGTVIGVASKADMLDKDGHLPKIRGVLLADAIGTTAGAMLGTSTVTTYVESSSGVMAGGRTGLTSVVSGLLFGLALFLSPIFLSIPSFATAPALIVVGFMMLSSVLKIDFDDIGEAIPAFIAIIAMPFLYSISEGIALGVISYVVINLVTGKFKTKKISVLMYVLAVIFVLKYIFI